MVRLLGRTAIQAMSDMLRTEPHNVVLPLAAAACWLLAWPLLQATDQSTVINRHQQSMASALMGLGLTFVALQIALNRTNRHSLDWIAPSTEPNAPTDIDPQQEPTRTRSQRIQIPLIATIWGLLIVLGLMQLVITIALNQDALATHLGTVQFLLNAAFLFIVVMSSVGRDIYHALHVRNEGASTPHTP